MGEGNVHTNFKNVVASQMSDNESILAGLVATSDAKLSTGVVEKCARIRHTIWSTGVLQTDRVSYKLWVKSLREVLQVPWYKKLLPRTIIAFYIRTAIRESSNATTTD